MSEEEEEEERLNRWSFAWTTCARAKSAPRRCGGKPRGCMRKKRNVVRWLERKTEMSGWSESRRDLNPERADPREAARPYLHKAQVPAGSFATDRPTDRRYLARSRRAKGSFRQLPPTCMVAEITEGYRSMRHDSRGRRTERMGRERWLFSSFNCGTVEVRRQTVVEREEKGRNRYRGT